MERIEKFLADALSLTRGDARHLIKAGTIKVNDKLTRAGTLIGDKDIITYDGEVLTTQKEIYIMMNKPNGTVCSKVEGGSVFNLLDEKLLTPRVYNLLHTIGRLDKETTGLLIFTTNGDMTHKIISPNTHAKKVYLVTLKNFCDIDEREKIALDFQKGVFIPRLGKERAFRAKEAETIWLSGLVCQLTIKEGKFHQIKRMFSTLGNEVVGLKRLAMGGVLLDEKLKPGEYRPLTEREIELLKA